MDDKINEQPKYLVINPLFVAIKQCRLSQKKIFDYELDKRFLNKMMRLKKIVNVLYDIKKLNRP